MGEAYPILLDVTQRPILVVGGGHVAARKVRGLQLADCGKRVTRPFEETDLDSALVVFAATDDAAVNDQIVTLCNLRGLLVCRADHSDTLPGDFAVPAIHRSGPITLAVTAGSSPALAVTVRDELAAHLDPSWGQLAEVVARLRGILLGNPKLDQQTRRDVLRMVCTKEGAEVLKNSGSEGMEMWIEERFPDVEF